MRIRQRHYEFACLLLMAAATGCNSSSNKTTDAGGAPKGDAHEHATAGPHGGHIVEIGADDYHAEVVDEGEATVYLLDGAAKATSPVDATEVVLNLTHDGQAEQFHLAASPLPEDPQGKASRFSSSDAELLADLEAGHAEVQLVVTINGKQHRGALEHEHGDHEHGH